ncbi:amino acid ABC transporter permease [Amycolatopsis sp. NPDC058340]|uniref:amino acid ABC transporter permease n=1 Tax=Amycolatopsis sp. NPDC058340 TaxID=3346453 RepID=UPI00365618E8
MAATDYTFDWTYLFTGEALDAALGGLAFTAGLSVVSLLAGSVVGLLCALVRANNVPVLGQLAYAYTEFFRTTPGLVQLIWIFYALPILLGVELPVISAGVLALTLNSGAVLGEVFRAGITSVGPGQLEAAAVLRFTRLQTIRHVILPQAFRHVLPALATTLILLIKESSLLSVIAVPEITYRAQSIVNATFRPLEVYTLLAVMYFVVTYPLSMLSGRLERKLAMV